MRFIKIGIGSGSETIVNLDHVICVQERLDGGTNWRLSDNIMLTALDISLEKAREAIANSKELQ